MQSRGVIHFKERAKQLNNFNGLKYDNITPTDIDGLIEYHNQAYIGFEGKYGEKDFFAPENMGQRLAIERLTDDLAKAGKKALFIIFRHDVEDTSQSVDVASAKAVAYRYNGEWIPANFPVKELCDQLLSMLGIRRLL